MKTLVIVATVILLMSCKSDQDKWNNVYEQNTIEAYQKYIQRTLRRNPESPFLKQAQEELGWLEANGNPDFVGLLQFKEKFPSSHHIEEANGIITKTRQDLHEKTRHKFESTIESKINNSTQKSPQLEITNFIQSQLKEKKERDIWSKYEKNIDANVAKLNDENPLTRLSGLKRLPKVSELEVIEKYRPSYYDTKLKENILEILQDGRRLVWIGGNNSRPDTSVLREGAISAYDKIKSDDICLMWSKISCDVKKHLIKGITVKKSDIGFKTCSQIIRNNECELEYSCMRKILEVGQNSGEENITNAGNKILREKIRPSDRIAMEDIFYSGLKYHWDNTLINFIKNLRKINSDKEKRATSTELVKRFNFQLSWDHEDKYRAFEFLLKEFNRLSDNDRLLFLDFLGGYFSANQKIVDLCSFAIVTSSEGVQNKALSILRNIVRRSDRLSENKKYATNALKELGYLPFVNSVN